jgi:hypothetical protein
MPADVMNQAAVEPSITVLERMHVDETKSSRGGLQHRVEPCIAHTVVRFDQSLHE